MFTGQSVQNTSQSTDRKACTTLSTESRITGEPALNYSWGHYTMQPLHQDQSTFTAGYQIAIAPQPNIYSPTPQHAPGTYDQIYMSSGSESPLSPVGSLSPTSSDSSFDQSYISDTAVSLSPTTSEYCLNQAYLPDIATSFLYPFDGVSAFAEPLASCVPHHNPSDAIPPTTNNTVILTNCEFDYLTDLLDQIQTTQDINHPVLATAFTGPEESHLRSLLHEIVKSDWFRSNKFEPKTEKGRSVFLSFLASDAAGAYRCLFKECNKNLDRQDRALGHIRMHLGHRPHACGGKCGVMGCQERFYCASYLRSHTKRQKEPCEICQESFFRQHLRKHRLVCQGAQQKLAMQVANEEFLAYMTSTS